MRMKTLSSSFDQFDHLYCFVFVVLEFISGLSRLNLLNNDQEQLHLALEGYFVLYCVTIFG